MERNEIVLAGGVLGLKMLVAHALAVAVRDHEDARGMLRELMTAADESLSLHRDAFAEHAQSAAMHAVVDEARDTVLYVAGITDHILRHLGAPPAASATG